MRVFLINRIARLSIVVAALIVMIPSVASAQGICVKTDEVRDNLSGQDRVATRLALLGAFESAGAMVDFEDRSCTEVYVVANLQLGASIAVSIVGPLGKRTARAASLDELALVYSQIARSLISGEPLGTSNESVNRTNVTSQQAAPRRVAADSIRYVRLGYGGLAAGGVSSGPAIGFGYRHELDQFGFDISFFNLIFTDNDNDTGITGSWAKLMANYFVEPLSNSTMYLGLGASWGGSAVTDGGILYSGSGLQGEVAAGYELFRASTVRTYVELTVTMPFYRSSARFSGEDDKRYTPSFVFAIGAGWGK